MNKKYLAFAATAFFAGFLSSQAYSQEYTNRYVTEKDARSREKQTGYQQTSSPVESESPVASPNPHIKIISWDSQVPARRIINAIQEGVTDQLAMLKLFSAPNSMRRTPQGREVWIYHWLWSYQDEQDPNTLLISMDKQGKRIKKYRKPVSLTVTFDSNDVVDNYVIRLLEVKKDLFDEK